MIVPPTERRWTAASQTNVSLTSSTPTAVAPTAAAGIANSAGPYERELTPVQLMRPSVSTPTAPEPAAADISDGQLSESLQRREFDFTAKSFQDH